MVLSPQQTTPYSFATVVPPTLAHPNPLSQIAWQSVVISTKHL